MLASPSVVSKPMTPIVVFTPPRYKETNSDNSSKSSSSGRIYPLMLTTLFPDSMVKFLANAYPKCTPNTESGHYYKNILMKGEMILNHSIISNKVWDMLPLYIISKTASPREIPATVGLGITAVRRASTPPSGALLGRSSSIISIPGIPLRPIVF